MEKKTVFLAWLDPDRDRDLRPPRYETEYSAGMDVLAAVSDSVTFGAGERVLIPTGFSVAIPEGYEIQVRPRSGLAVKHGITIVNAPGTIDADYRGEVKIALINLSDQPYTVHRGDRIAQLVLAPVCQADFTIVDRLESTQRGEGGFGHTGIR